MPSITVSFTTTPDRLPHIEPMLISMQNQSIQNFTLILWLCREYRRSGQKLTEKELPFFLSKYPIEVHFCEDFGSNTKLLPTLKKIQDPEAIILTVDDDTLYPYHWLKGLVQASLEDPSKAYGYRAKKLKRRVFKLPFIKKDYFLPLRYEGSQTILAHQPKERTSVDLLTGVWGICYRRHFFKEDYFKLNDCPAALHNDDIWANGHLARNHIERICLNLEGSFQDIPMERLGIRRLWDSVNNGQGLNNQVLKYFRHDF